MVQSGRAAAVAVRADHRDPAVRGLAAGVAAAAAAAAAVRHSRSPWLGRTMVGGGTKAGITAMAFVVRWPGALDCSWRPVSRQQQQLAHPSTSSDGVLRASTGGRSVGQYAQHGRQTGVTARGRWDASQVHCTQTRGELAAGAATRRARVQSGARCRC